MRAIPNPGVAVTRASHRDWARPSFVVLFLTTLVLHVWGLDRMGWAGTHYTAAVRAGTQSWKAFFFG
jgi:hypothetical protein